MWKWAYAHCSGVRSLINKGNREVKKNLSMESGRTQALIYITEWMGGLYLNIAIGGQSTCSVQLSCFKAFTFFNQWVWVGFFVLDSLSYYKWMIRAGTLFVQQFFVSRGSLEVGNILTAWLNRHAINALKVVVFFKTQPMPYEMCL